MNQSLLLQISAPELKLLVHDSVIEALKKHNFNVPAKEPDIYLSRKEAAAYLHCSQRSISNYVKTSKIKGYRLNGLLKFKQADLNKALVSTNKYSREK